MDLGIEFWAPFTIAFLALGLALMSFLRDIFDVTLPFPNIPEPLRQWLLSPRVWFRVSFILLGTSLLAMCSRGQQLESTIAQQETRIMSLDSTVTAQYIEADALGDVIVNSQLELATAEAIQVGQATELESLGNDVIASERNLAIAEATQTAQADLLISLEATLAAVETEIALSTIDNVSTPTPRGTYAIQPTSDNCEAFYRNYITHISAPSSSSYLIRAGADDTLVWESSVANSSVYGMLVCHFELEASASTASILFDEGSFIADPDLADCRPLMQLRAYSGHKEIEAGVDIENVTADALPFRDSPFPDENILSFVSCSPAPVNLYQFNAPDDGVVTVVVTFADGWNFSAITVRLSNFRLQALLDGE